MNAPRPSDAGLAALSYADRGWPVFPVHGITGRGHCTCRVGADCSDAGKHPRTMNGLTDATTDPAIVAAWWQRWPDSNIGLRTDPFVVLDIDPDKGGGESLQDLVNDWGRDFLETVTSLTGGGGQHLIYRAPRGMTIRNSASKIAPGIDIRAAGGYVVAPPSWHHSGNQYHWEVGYGPEDRAPADLPDWLIGLLTERGKSERLYVVGADDVLPKVILQARNVTLTTIAGVMRRRGLSEPAILAALLATNDERCSPPLAEAEVRKIAASVARYAPSDVPFGQAGEAGTEPIDPETTAERFTLHHVREAFEPQEPIDWAVVNLIIRGGVTVLFGAPGAKKTFAAIDMVVCIAIGRDWLHFETTQSPVLIIDEESGPRRLKRRLAECLRAYDAPDETPIWFTTLEGFDLRKPLDLAAIEKAITQSGAGVVLMDAWSDFVLGGNENAVEDMQPSMQALHLLAERLGVAIVVIHHANKQGDYSGSTAIIRPTDAAIAIESEPMSPKIDFIVKKLRDGEPQLFGATINFDKDEETFRLHPTRERPGANPEGKLTPMQKELLAYLREAGPSTVKDIHEGIGLGTKNTIEQNIVRLKQACFIRRINPGGRGTVAVYEAIERF